MPGLVSQSVSGFCHLGTPPVFGRYRPSVPSVGATSDRFSTVASPALKAASDASKDVCLLKNWPVMRSLFVVRRIADVPIIVITSSMTRATIKIAPLSDVRYL